MPHLTMGRLFSPGNIWLQELFTVNSWLWPASLRPVGTSPDSIDSQSAGLRSQLPCPSSTHKDPGNLCNISVPQFPHLSDEKNSASPEQNHVQL